MKIIRCATIGLSLNIFCKGVLQDLKQQGYEVVALSSPDEDLHELALREQVRTLGVPMERHISFFKDMKSLYTLVKVFRHERPDMVHSMTPKAGLLCMMAAWLARVPVRLHTFTGLVWPTSKGLSRQILKCTDRLTCACATHIIPEGEGVMSALRDNGITHKPMRVLGFGNIRGIDLAYWDRKKFECENPTVGKPFTFLFVGRIVGDKGINELVSAFSHLLTQVKEIKSERVKKCRLVLVGWIEDQLDPISPQTRQLIDSTPEIEAMGAKYGEDLLRCYAESDCFVFPSYREGFPNTVIEAGAMELPCIVTDINGSREIITNSTLTDIKEKHSVPASSMRLAPGERMSIRANGVVIPSQDADALYDAMCWMLTHPDERQLMAANARPLVAERFEQSFVREQLYAFYREVLG